jgi:hypothetical protein
MASPNPVFSRKTPVSFADFGIIAIFAAENLICGIMTTLRLRAELLRELNPIFDSEVAMQKTLTALRDIRRAVFPEVPVSKSAVRKGWSAAARKAHKQGDDQLVAK